METITASCHRLRNIVLVGFMGCGKSTLGRVLHQKLSYPLIDTDHVIEEQAGKSVAEIFADEGEDAFRSMETQLLQSLLDDELNHHIISTGGGMVLRPENRELLQQLGFVVWLFCSAEETYERTSRNNNRPLLQCNDPMGLISHMLSDRTPLYEDASHLKISTSGLEFDEISCGILESARYHFGTPHDAEENPSSSCSA
ncbi:shikimate kinase [Verrucomicrobiaceae bacterium R5-34]|uniref:Shikimate kinase n=1 Tax=Oceaniferula flava TaxID=2800421 RepID=A0AAE2VA25_9BACT|nr:shikimate kinase [Oceaniferula flavus]MBK1831843.1 shikimate kinase [Verrucomicrobiaceae bacterium R5-34]MBK1856168.1 shikimate kinase [Oceaniferula flavus]MBM1137475.1 shikimate kinase [Oceaniferula flavus]